MNESFADMMACRGGLYNLTGGDEPERVRGSRVTASFFPVLGVQPLAGRTFLPEDDEPGAERVVILSSGLWQRRFGARQDILGTKVMLDGNPHTVVGIMPATFSFPDRRAALYVPLAADYNKWDRDWQSLIVIGRLKQEVAFETAFAEMGTIAKQLGEKYPSTNKGWGVTMSPLRERFSQDARPLILVLMAAVGFVLLIACALESSSA